MKNNKNILLLLPLLMLLFVQRSAAQDKEEVKEEKEVVREMVQLKYYNDSNKVQYLTIQSLLRKGKKTEPQPNKSYELYLDSMGSSQLIAKVVTDQAGKAKSFLPPALTNEWKAATKHTFIAVEPGKEDAVTELEVSKAKLNIDTTSEEGTRNITVQVMKYENDEWLPAPDVELKVGIQRLGGVLNAGEEEAYTTDSTGTVTVELIKDSLPGDEKGNIVLVAKAEDNDQFGNLLVTKTVPWGKALKLDKRFFHHRSLWATKFYTPFWLLFMASSIVIGVWGTILYLVFQIVKIKNLTIEQWWYKPTPAYGGPKMDVEKLKVNKLTISNNRKIIHVALNGLKKNHVIYFHLPKMKSKSGQDIWSTEGWYTLNNIPE